MHNSEAAVLFCGQPTGSKADPTIRLRIAGLFVDLGVKP